MNADLVQRMARATLVGDLPFPEIVGMQGDYALLRGKRVMYLGRQGEQHTEWFPGARPPDAPSAD